MFGNAFTLHLSTCSLLHMVWWNLNKSAATNGMEFCWCLKEIWQSNWHLNDGRKMLLMAPLTWYLHLKKKFSIWLLKVDILADLFHSFCTFWLLRWNLVCRINKFEEHVRSIFTLLAITNFLLQLLSIL